MLTCFGESRQLWTPGGSLYLKGKQYTDLKSGVENSLPLRMQTKTLATTGLQIK